MKGSELVGRTYKPMFPYFASLKAAPGSNEGAFRVVADGYVTSDAGTGVVHQAPFFGEDDYRVCKKFGTLGFSLYAVRITEEALLLVTRSTMGNSLCLSVSAVMYLWTRICVLSTKATC